MSPGMILRQLAGGAVVAAAAAGCAIQCPDGTSIYDGADANAVAGRYGEPDIVAWESRGSPEYLIPGVPTANLRCGNEPGTLSYFYLSRAEVFRFEQGRRVIAVDHIDEGEREALHDRADRIRREANQGGAESTQ